MRSGLKEAIGKMMENFAQHYIITCDHIIDDDGNIDRLDEALLKIEAAKISAVRELDEETLNNYIKQLEYDAKHDRAGYSGECHSKVRVVVEDFDDLMFVKEYLVMRGDIDRRDFMRQLFDVMDSYKDKKKDDMLLNADLILSKAFPDTYSDNDFEE